MLIRPVKFETTGFYKVPTFRVYNDQGLPIKILKDNDLLDANFLCKRGHYIFVSGIQYEDSFGYFVQNLRGKEAVQITELSELYLIE